MLWVVLTSLRHMVWHKHQVALFGHASSTPSRENVGGLVFISDTGGIRVAEMGDEIDLRQYVDVIVRRWKLVLVAAVSAALVAAVVSFLMPPVYEAVAGVVIIKATTELLFEPQFKTLSEDDLAMAGARQAVDTSARREAFAALVKNGAIAAQVVDEIGDTLLPEERKVNVLVGMVEGEIRKGSDLIEIKVTCNDAAKAARIANVWGSEYEKYVNAIYSDAPESYAQVEHQATVAKAEYDEVEAALTVFIADNRIDDLSRQITETQQVITAYSDARTDSRLIPFNEEQHGRLQTLKDYWKTKNKLELLLADVESLRAHTASGGGKAARTNGLALLLLKAQIFASSEELPGDLQLQLGNVEDLGSEEEQAADLDALIEVMQERLAALDVAISKQSLVILSNADYRYLSFSGPVTDTLSMTIYEKYPNLFEFGDLADLSLEVGLGPEALTEEIDRLQDTMLELQAEVARELARKRELTRSRDLAWDSYTMLARKTIELNISAQTTGSEVRFAAPAVEPRGPVSPKKMQNTAIAGMLGLMIGLFGAFAIEYFGEPRRQAES